jgi:Methylamine utilisation protein MauE
MLTGVNADGAWLSALLLGTIFLISGALKLIHWTQFRDTLSAMELLPSRLARGVGWVLPPLEVALGAAAVAQWHLALTGPALLGLLVGFILALTVHRLRGGKELVCGCFADFEHKTATVPLILRNVLLLALAAPLLLGPRDVAGRSLADWLPVGAAVVGLMLTWMLLRRLTETVTLLRAAAGDDN